MIPHERSLVKKLEGRPFVLVGVNSDRDPEFLKKQLKEHQVTWRSFQDKGQKEREISGAWRVRSWPTLYIVDDQGVIRKRWVGAPPAEQLGREVEKWVKAAEERKQPGK